MKYASVGGIVNCDRYFNFSVGFVTGFDVLYIVAIISIIIICTYYNSFK